MGKAFPYPVVPGVVLCPRQPSVVGQSLKGRRDRLEALRCVLQSSWHSPTLVDTFRVLSPDCRRLSL